MRRLALAVVSTALIFANLVLAGTAAAWTWPTGGAVLQPFSFDHAHPYAAGQHRGVDVAGAQGDDRGCARRRDGHVRGHGARLGPERHDRHARRVCGDAHASRLDLGLARRGGRRGRGVGTVGPTGDAEVPGPYVHLGVRLEADEQGYVDPLGLLPARAAPEPPARAGTGAPGGARAAARARRGADAGSSPARGRRDPGRGRRPPPRRRRRRSPSRTRPAARPRLLQQRRTPRARERHPRRPRPPTSGRPLRRHARSTRSERATRGRTPNLPPRLASSSRNAARAPARPLVRARRSVRRPAPTAHSPRATAAPRKPHAHRLCSRTLAPPGGDAASALPPRGRARRRRPAAHSAPSSRSSRSRSHTPATVLRPRRSLPRCSPPSRRSRSRSLRRAPAPAAEGARPRSYHCPGCQQRRRRSWLRPPGRTQRGIATLGTWRGSASRRTCSRAITG